MSIRRHLILLISIAISTVVFLGATALIQLHHNAQLVRTLTDGALPGFLSATDLSSRLKDIQIASTSLFYSPEPAGAARERALAMGTS